MSSAVVWEGPDWLRSFLVPVDQLVGTWTVRDDLHRIEAALADRGQLRPVLLDQDRVVCGRGYLADAARALGWTHVAARFEASELAMNPDAVSQTTLADEIERSGGGGIEALAREKLEADEDDVDAINALSADPDGQWVGLPEFVKVDDAIRVVISLDSEEDREALFDVLGIVTVHKGTRGTLSVWWPDRPKEDLSSLWFGVDGEDVPEAEEEIVDALVEEAVEAEAAEELLPVPEVAGQQSLFA